MGLADMLIQRALFPGNSGGGGGARAVKAAVYYPGGTYEELFGYTKKISDYLPTADELTGGFLFCVRDNVPYTFTIGKEVQIVVDSGVTCLMVEYSGTLAPLAYIFGNDFPQQGFVLDVENGPDFYLDSALIFVW